MIVLAFDTSLALCSAALWRDGRVLAHRESPMARGHAEALMPMVVEVMKDAATAFSELSRIGVTTGPGSFTGIRIGIAAAKGLALGTNAPAFGITTMLALAKQASPDSGGRDIFVVVDSGRPEVFVQIFAPDLTPRGEIASTADPAALLPAAPVVIAGNGAEAVRATFGARCGAYFSKSEFPDARAVAELVAAMPDSAAGVLAPLYIHPSYAKPPVGQ